METRGCLENPADPGNMAQPGAKPGEIPPTGEILDELGIRRRGFPSLGFSGIESRTAFPGTLPGDKGEGCGLSRQPLPGSSCGTRLPGEPGGASGPAPSWFTRCARTSPCIGALYPTLSRHASRKPPFPEKGGGGGPSRHPYWRQGGGVGSPGAPVPGASRCLRRSQAPRQSLPIWHWIPARWD